MIAHLFLRLFFALGHAFQRIGDGAGHHVYWPLVMARRIVGGEPHWQVHDLSLGKQPTRAVDIATAEADPGLVKLPMCRCDDPACTVRGKTAFVPKSAAAQVEAVLDARFPIPPIPPRADGDQ